MVDHPLISGAGAAERDGGHSSDIGVWVSQQLDKGIDDSRVLELSCGREGGRKGGWEAKRERGKEGGREGGRKGGRGSLAEP